jgi:spermidine dehydrogenase
LVRVLRGVPLWDESSIGRCGERARHAAPLHRWRIRTILFGAGLRGSTVNTDDRKLGMGRQITRRDFLNGAAVGAGSALLGGSLFSEVLYGADSFGDHGGATADAATGEYYPPAKMGMRGNHDGSFTYAHMLRDGVDWKNLGKDADTGEQYDLVVVGGGISGLAAAYFFRKQAGPSARVLILDNHDDFGGHAKRNEFTAGGRMVLSYGGTQSIESPGSYSEVAAQLLKDIGVEVQRFYKDYDRHLYDHLGTGCFFDQETFGRDAMLTGMNRTSWPGFLARAPLSEAARKDIARVYTEKVDYLPGLSREEKYAKLRKISYAEYLTTDCKVTTEALPFFQAMPHDLFGVGIDAVSALTCYQNPDDYESFTYPGFDGLGFPEREKDEPYIFHFPDGNASVARLLVRALIPAAVPGSTMDDVVTAHADYRKLDVPGAPVRVRLNSTVVHVWQEAESGGAVQVAYERNGKLQQVHGAKCVLACYNVMIPYICPDLPSQQKEALAYLVKTPLVYTHVALRNWQALANLGVRQIVAPGGYHTHTALDFPVSVGAYKFPSKPHEPAVLFMLRTPCKPGLPMREQYRAGRRELMETPFAAFERNIRDQLQKMLGGGGFDAAKDIQGITVNRWAHGYAYGPNALFDPDWKEEEKPWVLGRARFGNMAIANSDAGANAYTNEAIDQGFRAVQELKAS